MLLLVKHVCKHSQLRWCIWTETTIILQEKKILMKLHLTNKQTSKKPPNMYWQYLLREGSHYYMTFELRIGWKYSQTWSKAYESIVSIR